MMMVRRISLLLLMVGTSNVIAQSPEVPAPLVRFLARATDASRPPVVIDPSGLATLQRRVRIGVRGSSRLEALRMLTTVTGMHLVYEPARIAGSLGANLTDSVSIADALRTILTGTRLDVLIERDGTMVLVSSALRLQRIAGVVSSRDGAPLANAEVIVTMAPNREIFRAASDLTGRYVVSIDNGSGDYLVYVSAVGYAPFRKRLTGTIRDSLFTVDAVLAPSAATLAPVRTTAQRARPLRADEDRSLMAADGSAEPVYMVNGSISPDRAGDLIAMAATVPGVHLTPQGELSAFGLDASQNRVSLNGMPMEGSKLPRGLFAATSVVTNSYDPTLGGFSGAGIYTRIAPGSALLYRHVELVLDLPQLQSGGSLGGRLGERFTNIDATMTQSNELIQDLWAYSAGIQVTRRTSALPSLSVPGARFVTQDSVERFLRLLSGAGIPSSLASIPNERASTTFTGAFRADKARAQDYGGSLVRDTKPRVTVIGAANASESNNIGAFDWALPIHGSSQRRGDASLQVSYSRYVGSELWNLSETRSAFTLTTTANEPYVNLPEVRVRVGSLSPDGTPALTTLFAGGAPNGKSSQTQWTWSTVSELSFSSAEHPTHLVKMAATSELAGFAYSGISTLPGTYDFNSLADLEGNAPARFSRVLNVPTRGGGEWSGALAVADFFAVTPELTLIFGPRVETNVFTRRPAYNARLEQLLGVRTDAVPNQVHVSPRFGFRWQYVERRRGGGLGGESASDLGRMLSPPKGILSGGIGEFRNTMAPALLASAMGATGLPGSSVERIECVGGAVPSPKWQLFANSDANIPTDCAAGFSSLTDSAPPVGLIDPRYAAARRWSSNIMWASSKGSWFYRVNASWSLNVDQPGLVDLNFDGVPRFTLAQENGRPVFVAPASIAPMTGLLSSAGARRTASFGSVMSMRSDLRSEIRQVALTVTPYSFQHLSKWAFSGTYAFSDLRSFSRGFGETTSGNPLIAEWGRGAVPRHALTAQAGYAFNYKRGSYVYVTGFGRVSSGFNFTPVVGSDVNGDGYANDRAFVFDTTRATDQIVAAGMKTLLQEGPARARDCLAGQTGAIAARNSCTQPPSLDLNLGVDWSHQFGELRRGFKLSLNLENPLSGMDQLLHGASGLRGWGSRAPTDPTLLYVTSFDPAARQYHYQVNPRFGDSRPASLGLLNPFRMSVIVRFDVNVPSQELITARYMRPDRNSPGVRPGVDTIMARMRAFGSSPDYFGWVLSLQDSLLLSQDQVRALEEARIRVRAISDSSARAIAKYLYDLPSSYDAKEAAAHVSRVRVEARDHDPTGELLQAILTPLQFRLLGPEALRLIR